MAILIDGLPGPAYTQITGTTFTFTNEDDTGVITWQWVLIDRPTGSTADLTTPTDPSTTLTIDVEGTYLVSLVTNDDVDTLTRAAVVLTNYISSADTTKAPDLLRYIAATENDEVGGSTRGWTKDLNRWLEFIDKDQVWPRKVAVWCTTAFSGPARITSYHVLDNGVKLITVSAASSSTLAQMPVECFFDETTTANSINYAIVNGPTIALGVDLSGADVNDPVYLQDDGSIGLTTGTYTQILGYVIDNSSNSKITVHISKPDFYHGLAPGGSIHPVATTSVAGFLSATDKLKLDSVAELSSTLPTTISSTSSIGVGTTAARSDHVHAHGSQSDPNMHAVATTSVAGFLSAIDKTYLSELTLGQSGGATIYARTTGDDDTGDGSLGNPYRTFVRALRDVPIIISNAQYIIDITDLGDEELPDDFCLLSYVSNNTDNELNASLIIRATLATNTSLVGISGVVAQTYANVSCYVITFSGQTWTPDEFAGLILQQAGSLYMPIVSNTSDTITVMSDTAPIDGVDYVIVEQSASLSSAVTSDTLIGFNNIAAPIHVSGVLFDSSNTITYGLSIAYCNNINFTYCSVVSKPTMINSVGNTNFSKSILTDINLNNGNISLDTDIIGDYTENANKQAYNFITINDTYVTSITNTNPMRINLSDSYVDGNITILDALVNLVNIEINGVIELTDTTGKVYSLHQPSAATGGTYGFILNNTCTIKINDVDITDDDGDIKINNIYPISWDDFNDTLNPYYHNIYDTYGSSATGSRLYYVNV
jgi:hypothetical protein